MSDTIDKIKPISSTTKASILRKTAYALPLRPSESGMSAEDIKKAFYSGMTDKEDSVMSELERVISEANNVLKNKQDNNLGSDNSNKVLVTNAQGAIEAVSADAVPTDNSNKPITSSGVYNYPAIKFAESERQKSKNLFNIDNLTFGWGSCGDWKISDNKLIGASGNKYGYFEISSVFEFLKPNIPYTLSYLTDFGSSFIYLYTGDGTGFAWGNGVTKTFTQSEINSFMDRIGIFYGSETSSVTYSNIQVEQGSVVTDYQQCNGAIVHSNDTPVKFAQEQYNKQKNLLDKTKFKTGCYIGTTGAFDGSNLKYKTTDPIDVKAGSTITVSCQNFTFTNESCFVFFKDGVFVSSSDGGKTTSTVPTNANQVIYNFYKNGITEDDLQYAQLEYGAIATEYQSYQGGEFVQENTLNEKVSTYSMMPSSNKVTNIYDFTTTGYHNYTAPANGYVTVFINLGTASPNDLWLQNQTVGLEITFPRVNNTSVYVPCKKGDTITFYTSEALTSQYNSSKFIYAED